MKVKDAVKMGITSFYYKSLGSKIKDISDLMEVECHTEVWENGGGCERTIQDQIAVLEIDKMTMEQAIKEVEVAVGMHDTDKANLGWKVIKSNLEALEQHKALEQELGIDLITLFKALTDGIVETYFTFNQGKPLKSFKPDFDKKCFYMLGGRDGPDLYYYFKDYGKTWALTKGELEK